ncbi:DUF4136 domain-containing protein [Rufibacter sp. XAAS-G3-1]|uniref:DUF4136 domain-containing protein n=1 Tax=Rufibacter sp. XAAS-G3-1 TaxID=2729134 RepID=UPI0015E74BC1|nr:DUF4136 domain-containing protein [Rufibacter sp. XAAS-G3-1]
MKKYVGYPFGAILILFLNACSPIRIVNTQAAPDFSLADYQTFGFAEDNAAADTSQIRIPPEHIASLQREVTKQLQQRGVTYSASNPDLLVNLGIVVMEKAQTRQTDFRTDAPYYTGQRRYTWRSREVEVGRYQEGTLSVHLVNRAQNNLVWSSEAEAVVPNKSAKVQERIAEGVEKLFSSLPTTNN